MSMTIENTGWWWIPEKADDHVPGVLHFSEQDGLRLKLFGSLGGVQDLGDTLPLILGLVPGLRVTLVRASLVQRQVHVPGFDSTEYQVGIAFLGEHFETTEALRFSKLNLQLTHLDDWLAESKIHWETPHIDDLAKRYEFGYEHEKPEPELIENGTTAVGYMVHMHQTTLSAELRVSPVIGFELEASLDIDDWHRSYLRPVVNLLSLGTGRTVHLSKVSVFPPDSDDRYDVQVVAKHFVVERPDDSILSSGGMLFSRRVSGHHIRRTDTAVADRPP